MEHPIKKILQNHRLCYVYCGVASKRVDAELSLRQYFQYFMTMKMRLISHLCTISMRHTVQFNLIAIHNIVLNILCVSPILSKVLIVTFQMIVRLISIECTWSSVVWLCWQNNRLDYIANIVFIVFIVNAMPEFKLQYRFVHAAFKQKFAWT